MVAFAVVMCNNIPIISGHLKQWQFCVEVPTDDSYYWNRSVVNDSFGSARGGEWPRLPTFHNKDCVPQLRHSDVRKRLGSCRMNVYSWWSLTRFLVKNYSCKCTILLWTLNSMLVIVNLVIDYGIPETYLLSLGMFTMITYVYYSIEIQIRLTTLKGYSLEFITSIYKRRKMCSTTYNTVYSRFCILHWSYFVK